MSIPDALNFVLVFVLVFFRTAGLMLAAPLFGSAKIPKRLKVLFSLVLAAGLVDRIGTPPAIPGTTLQLAAGIGGELIFGLVMGLGLSLTFIAVTWAVELEYPALGITDHGTMTGAVQHYKACRKAGIEPLIGVEAYLLFDRHLPERQKLHHMLLVAFDLTGYRKPSKRNTEAFDAAVAEITEATHRLLHALEAAQAA
jgi:hypothetical protein